MRAVRQSIGGLGNLMFKQAYLIARVADGIIPDAYVQSENYFAMHKQLIRDLFSDGIVPIDKISLHIRRGDYLKTPDFYVDLSKTQYYQEAVKMFPNEKLLVFCKDNQGTDKTDREWCVEFLDTFLPRKQWEFAPIENSETDDLNLMAGCKHNIMANSTFSWWAAWLNPNPDKKVICPKGWFVDGIERCELLDNWIKI